MKNVGSWLSPGGKVSMGPKTHNIVIPVYLRKTVKVNGKYDQKLVSTLGVFREPGA
jgi:hypothetical protein